MNQHQRKFLLEEIEKQYRREKDELERHRPDPPSLNNYLIAAILDGSSKMRPVADIERETRERVRDLGKGDTLVSPESRRWGRSRGSEEEVEMVSLPALLIFEPPPAYAEKLGEYEAALKKWEQEMKALDASINAMRIRVQVGSDKALESIVQQADKLCSMSLTASKTLLLTQRKED